MLFKYTVRLSDNVGIAFLLQEIPVRAAAVEVMTVASEYKRIFLLDELFNEILLEKTSECFVVYLKYRLCFQNSLSCGNIPYICGYVRERE